MTGMVLNIITLRLYQVYEVLNAKSREDCDRIDKKNKKWLWSYISIIVIIRVCLSISQFIDYQSFLDKNTDKGVRRPLVIQVISLVKLTVQIVISCIFLYIVKKLS